jgi:hypothetical protein
MRASTNGPGFAPEPVAGPGRRTGTMTSPALQTKSSGAAPQGMRTVVSTSTVAARSAMTALSCPAPVIRGLSAPTRPKATAWSPRMARWASIGRWTAAPRKTGRALAAAFLSTPQPCDAAPMPRRSGRPRFGAARGRGNRRGRGRRDKAACSDAGRRDSGAVRKTNCQIRMERAIRFTDDAHAGAVTVVDRPEAPDPRRVAKGEARGPRERACDVHAAEINHPAGGCSGVQEAAAVSRRRGARRPGA